MHLLPGIQQCVPAPKKFQILKLDIQSNENIPLQLTH